LQDELTEYANQKKSAKTNDEWEAADKGYSKSKERLNALTEKLNAAKKIYDAEFVFEKER